MSVLAGLNHVGIDDLRSVLIQRESSQRLVQLLLLSRHLQSYLCLTHRACLSKDGW
jgi:hypothetical protein